MTGTFKIPVQAPETTEVKKDLGRVMKTDVDPPFTEYRAEHKVPFTADYMGTPLTWDQQDMVGDVTAIEDYLKEQVSLGELSNSTKAAKEKLKHLEKMAGIDKLESTAQRLIKLSEFVSYLRKLDGRIKNEWI